MVAGFEYVLHSVARTSHTSGVFESPFLTTLEVTRHENGGLERQEPTRERVADPGFHSPLVGGLGG
jgi:hypothetical protein